ncbi:MAG: GTPase RsgA, partial [Verrucomicrobiales bacterium]|nr:GTPase RsgA [Verrucomicrobiales bacterium]
MTLKSLGWSDFFAMELQSLELGDEIIPARVSRNSKHIYHVICEKGKLIARVSGAFRHQAKESSDYPSVGDWVAIKIGMDGLEAEIRGLLTRRTVFSRQAVSASGTESKSYEQIVATNVDVAFLVAALDGSRGFNLRRIERYLTLTRNSGADPVILLNKADLSSDLEADLEQAKSIAAGARVHAICALEEGGIEPLRQYVGDGKTIVLLGPSGIGKSTIINGIAGEEMMKTSEVRKGDSRGRHTTT